MHLKILVTNIWISVANHPLIILWIRFYKICLPCSRRRSKTKWVLARNSWDSNRISWTAPSEDLARFWPLTCKKVGFKLSSPCLSQSQKLQKSTQSSCLRWQRKKVLLVPKVIPVSKKTQLLKKQPNLADGPPSKNKSLSKVSKTHSCLNSKRRNR